MNSHYQAASRPEILLRLRCALSKINESRSRWRGDTDSVSNIERIVMGQPIDWKVNRPSLCRIYALNRKTIMARIIQGKLDAKGSRFAIVISRFNSLISDRLLSGALDALERHGASQDDISIAWVPGSFEIPPITRKMALSKKYDAVICLGALLRGETPHLNISRLQLPKSWDRSGWNRASR
jgi:hypothetical protein